MKKVLFLISNVLMLFLSEEVSGQKINFIFKEIDTNYSKKIYIINTTDFNDLNIGSESALVDSISIINKKATFEFKKNLPTGFYRFQCTKNGKSPYYYSFSNKAIIFLIKEQSTTVLSLNIKSNNNFLETDYDKLSNSKDNIFIREQLDFLQKSFSLIDRVKKQEINQEDYLNKSLILLKGSFLDAKTNWSKYFYGAYIHTAKDIFEAKIYDSIINFKINNKFSQIEKKTIIYKSFIDFLDTRSTEINLGNLNKLEIFDIKLNKLSYEFGEGLYLVDFWASWCNPCRVDNNSTLPKCKNPNLNILSFSFDTDIKKWQKATLDDKMDWPQYLVNHGIDSDFYKNNIGDKGLPQNLIIYKKQIIAKNLKGEILALFIKKFINKNFSNK